MIENRMIREETANFLHACLDNITQPYVRWDKDKTLAFLQALQQRLTQIDLHSTVRVSQTHGTPKLSGQVCELFVADFPEDVFIMDGYFSLSANVNSKDSIAEMKREIGILLIRLLAYLNDKRTMTYKDGVKVYERKYNHQ